MALKARKESFQYLTLAYWSEEAEERGEGSIRMGIYPEGKGKSSASCQKPQKAWVFRLMPFHTFLLQGRLSTIPISLPGIGVDKCQVPQMLCTEWVLTLSWEQIPWPGDDIARGREKAGAGWVIPCLLILGGCVSCSGSFQPYSWADHWGKGTGKVICIPTLHLKAINYWQL